ncbi:heavy metal-associated isoprenylated plant protein 39-like [Punica granatum]|uniref:Uncharacterized protein n=2 Tax=Punica granatum TaxID=22663 RepID=A0A2I0J3Y2_PUNGR|nr:heavy metal-associated isoprenylated plant protein 39-like [Punica granatum]PKI50922.1 hypothetical protein CRG98_028652 [Punica granatum]
MKKLVLKLHLRDSKEKQKAMTKVSGIPGVISVAIDMIEKKMTVTGEVDAVEVTSKLRKLCHAEIEMVGEAKEEKKNDGGSKKEGGDDKNKVDFADLQTAYYAYPWVYHPHQTYMPVVYAEENPNPCVIC